MKTKSEQKMMAMNYIESYFEEIRKSILHINKQEIAKVIEKILIAYKNNKKVYILGNGGSASIASHMACDLGKGTLNRIYDETEKRLKIISLTDNTALITAYANDLGYEDIFLQQLRNLIEKGDILISISGSGNSKNILKAVTYANKIGASTIGLTGFKGRGKLASLVDLSIVVNSDHYGPIEDIHQMLGHIFASFIAKIKQEEYGDPNTKRNKAIPYTIE